MDPWIFSNSLHKMYRSEEERGEVLSRHARTCVYKHTDAHTCVHTHTYTPHSQSPVLPYDKGAPFWLYSCASEDLPSHNSGKEGENWGHQNLIIITTGSLSMMGTRRLGIQYSHNDAFRVQNSTGSFLKSLWVLHHWLLVISLWHRDWFISIMERGDRKKTHVISFFKYQQQIQWPNQDQNSVFQSPCHTVLFYKLTLPRVDISLHSCAVLGHFYGHCSQAFRLLLLLKDWN